MHVSSLICENRKIHFRKPLHKIQLRTNYFSFEWSLKGPDDYRSQGKIRGSIGLAARGRWLSKKKQLTTNVKKVNEKGGTERSFASIGIPNGKGKIPVPTKFFQRRGNSTPERIAREWKILKNSPASGTTSPEPQSVIYLVFLGYPSGE